MSKRERRVAFQEEIEFSSDKKQKIEPNEEDGKGSRFKANHSLDSDEEVDVEQDHGLGDEDLAAQEDDTVRFDDGIEVTPFNLQEELEEGRFDAHGNYHLTKDPASVQDNWLEGVDWSRVEEQREWREGGVASSTEVKDSPEPEVDILTLYKQIMELLQPGETLTKLPKVLTWQNTLQAVRRLGGSKSQSASDKWRKQKNKGMTPKAPPIEQTGGDREALERLTGLADQLVAGGDYSVYESTYEQIKYNITLKEKAKEPVDMFAELEGPSGSEPSVGGASEGGMASDEVLWEYKWANKEEEKIHGPFTSSQMANWQCEGYFPEGVWVRKSGNKDAQFYSSKRIDFDLYT